MSYQKAARLAVSVGALHYMKKSEASSKPWWLTI
jgi:hypothetical protein